MGFGAVAALKHWARMPDSGGEVPFFLLALPQNLGYNPIRGRLPLRLRKCQK
jgi:hypothetical protein